MLDMLGHVSMNWFKGKSTGNHRCSHEIWGFPVNCPLNQSIVLQPWFCGLQNPSCHRKMMAPASWSQPCQLPKWPKIRCSMAWSFQSWISKTIRCFQNGHHGRFFLDWKSDMIKMALERLSFLDYLVATSRTDATNVGWCCRSAFLEQECWPGLGLASLRQDGSTNFQ